MANITDPLAQQVHGTNPQNLVEKILRGRIYESLYWKESCFGLTAETVLDKAVKLDHVGGTYSHNAKPCPFICLALKLLQIQPEKEIIVEYIKQEEFKYARALGAFYLRLTGRPVDIYQYLEPLYNDYRKLASRGVTGWTLSHIDEFVDELLTSETCCDVTLPRLPKREMLENMQILRPRVSALEDDLGSDEEEGGRPGVSAPAPVLSVRSSGVQSDAASAGVVGGVSPAGHAEAPPQRDPHALPLLRDAREDRSEGRPPGLPSEAEGVAQRHERGCADTDDDDERGTRRDRGAGGPPPRDAGERAHDDRRRRRSPSDHSRRRGDSREVDHYHGGDYRRDRSRSRDDDRYDRRRDGNRYRDTDRYGARYRDGEGYRESDRSREGDRYRDSDRGGDRFRDEGHRGGSRHGETRDRVDHRDRPLASRSRSSSRGGVRLRADDRRREHSRSRSFPRRDSRARHEGASSDDDSGARQRDRSPRAGDRRRRDERSPSRRGGESPSSGRYDEKRTRPSAAAQATQPPPSRVSAADAGGVAPRGGGVGALRLKAPASSVAALKSGGTSAGGTGSGSSKDGSMSVEQTNALRLSLGLKPLKE